MAFRRFRSGTLERSVRRFGRMPKFGQFAKKSHSWKYVELDEQALDAATLAPTDVSIIDSDDWQPAATPGLGVRNVSFDIAIGYTWSTQTIATTFDSWALRYGFFIKDRDDDPEASINDYFAEGRALEWHQVAFNTVENQAESGDSESNVRQFNRRVRFKARFLKFDEEVRFATGFSTTASSTLADSRVWLFGRVSWETP